ELDIGAYMKRFDTFLYGRKTYEMILPMGNKPTRGITNYVVSTTITQVAPNFKLINGNVEKEILKVKSKEGKDIAVYGGASLLASLLNLNLVDEIHISVIPVLLGKGKPMVDVLDKKVWLTYIESKTYGNGTVQLMYKVNKAAK
ncbi:MAG TPA: dihydrofolate reductase, partial [Chitinophagaceae bacterium]|nr:dihydrofolate reductase [Chitinophagaceae bacterium]